MGSTSRGSHRSAAHDRRGPLLLLVGAFLLFSALSLDDFGITWDEGVKIHQDNSVLQILQRTETFDPRVIHIPGYFYVFDAARSLYAMAVAEALGASDPVLVHHSFNLFVSTACVALLYLLVLEISGEPRLSALSAASLALLPRFLGHSQNNPKDLPAVFLFLLFAALVVKVAVDPRWRVSIPAALALGVNLTTRILSVFLLPILALWLVLRRREVAVRRVRPYLLVLLGGLVSAFAFWPALWHRPLEMLGVAAKQLQVLGTLEFDVLYLGRIQPWTDLPWHFLSVNLLVSSPLPFLALLLLSPIAARSWRVREAGKCDVAWLGFVWVGGLLVAEQLSPFRYDGIRHFLVILPGIAVLVASGAEWAIEGMERICAGWKSAAARTLFAWSVPAACAALTCAEIAAIHPYQSAYLNPLANAVGGPHTEEWMEVEYWGNAYKEGVEWINRHAEPEAEVFFPLGGGQRSGEDIARYYARRRLVPRGEIEAFRDTSKPRYLIFITRVAWYDALIERVRAEYQPVFSIRRQRATLLEIYSNRSGRRSG